MRRSSSMTEQLRKGAALALAVLVGASPGAAFAQARPRPRTSVPTLEKGPEAAARYKTKGDALKDAGKIDDAMREYANAVEADPTHVPALQEYGRTLYARQKFPEAAELFKKLIVVAPGEPVAYYNLAYALRKTGDYAGAAQAYEAYVKANPEDADGYYGLAECYRALQRTSDAAAQYEIYIVKEQRPGEQAWVEKARTKLNALRAGTMVASNVTTLSSNDTPPVTERAVEQPVAAPVIAAPEIVAAVAPVVAPAAAPVEVAPVVVAVAQPAPVAPVVIAPAPAASGGLAIDKGATAPVAAAVVAPVAAPVAAPMRSRDPTAAIYKIREGDQMFGQKRFREALFAYQDAVKLDDASVNALLKMGLAYANLNYYKEAIEKWERVLQLDPVNQYAKTYIERAKPRLAAAGPVGDAPKPLESTTGATATASAASPAPVAAPLTARASPEDEAAAKDAYRRAVQLMNGSKYPDAIVELTTAIAKNPAFVNAYVARGGAHLGARSYNESAADYQKSLALDPTLATPLYGLARVYERLSDKPKACDYYRRYATSNGRDATAPLKRSADAAADALCGGR